ncbi:hypothetical protein M408DRAFT_177869 [Serendipita vermifera MAFF 305830]|uniref:Uncharacterized protein n=1 Tax=Serendipita vermifera MAFF 305830 TaxID=933852 RepID=A0A0C2WKD7_SERVB|nr:hypothetical protein M408DRAFT_177869 [Serendipita vermifera MAFF 305830]
MEMSAQEKFRLISVINLLDSKGTIDISGEWNAVEIGISHRSGNTNTRGTYLFRMITPTTFIGLGAETDTYPSGNQLSYTFTATNGVVGDNRAISWLCDCAETQWKWRVEAKLAEDGMVMSGRMIGVSGGALDGPGVYTRVR